MTVKGTHPFGEALARKLFGIENVPPKEAQKVVHRAAQFALNYVVPLEEERDRLQHALDVATRGDMEPEDRAVIAQILAGEDAEDNENR